MNVQYLSKAMLDYSETSENVCLTFNQHIELKNKKFEILVHLTFNLSINPGVVPDQMKLARVAPLFKSSDKRLLSNYRPVSVLPIF